MEWSEINHIAPVIMEEAKKTRAKEDADVEHSISLDLALKRLLPALSFNGELIPKAHGGPARQVTGYCGTINV